MPRGPMPRLDRFDPFAGERRAELRARLSEKPPEIAQEARPGRLAPTPPAKGGAPVQRATRWRGGGVWRGSPVDGSPLEGWLFVACLVVAAVSVVLLIKGAFEL
jgi:hypothetical protein